MQLQVGDMVIDPKSSELGPGQILKIGIVDGQAICLIRFKGMEGEFWVTAEDLQKVSA